MNHRDYVAQRELRDPEFRALRHANQPMLEFQLALIRARVEANLTQQELAERLGTTQSAIAKWENGTNTPKIDTIQRLAGALGVKFEITPSHVTVTVP